MFGEAWQPATLWHGSACRPHVPRTELFPKWSRMEIWSWGRSVWMNLGWDLQDIALVPKGKGGNLISINTMARIVNSSTLQHVIITLSPTSLSEQRSNYEGQLYSLVVHYGLYLSLKG